MILEVFEINGSIPDATVKRAVGRAEVGKLLPNIADAGAGTVQADQHKKYEPDFHAIKTKGAGLEASDRG
jgi:hypothetical protein